MAAKIAIIEIDYHAEVLKNTCTILQNTPFEISIYTNEKIARDVKSDKNSSRFQWVIKSQQESIRGFFKRHVKEINQSDVVLFNTLASHFRFFLKLDIKPVSILRIHNSNAYFQPGKNFKPVFTPYFIWKDSSHILRKTVGELDWYYRKKFLRKIDYLCFPDETLEEYARKTGLIKSYQTSLVLPLTAYDPKFDKLTDTNEIYITIPGTIDQRRRDYETVITAFESIKTKLTQRVVLTLLGRPKDHYGHQIIKRMLGLGSGHIQTRHYNERIPFNEFDNVLKDTDFLILPIVINTKYVIYREKYGYTKISGSINDLIRCGKPAIINRDYPLNKNLDQITTTYTSQVELSENIVNWVNHRDYKKYSGIIKQALVKYSEENIRKHYISTFERLIKTNN